MIGTPRIFVVAESDPPDSVVGALAREWSVAVRRPGELNENSEADCLVCCDPASRAWATTGAPSTPTVACGDPPIARGQATTAVNTDGDAARSPTVGNRCVTDCTPSSVVDAVRAALAEAPSPDTDHEQRITELHEGVTDFASIRESKRVFERTVEVAERVLDFDRCAAVQHQDGVLVPVAESGNTQVGDAREMSVEEGVTGWSYRTGNSRLIDRVSADSDARPSKAEFASGLSVPIGDYGVFQSVSTEPGAFDEQDLELAELLATHAGETLARIETTDELRAQRDRLDSLFENDPDPAIAFEIVDGDPVARRVNAAFEEVFGYETDEIVGENVDEYILPEQSERHRQGKEFNRRLQEGQNVSAEVVRRTRDGPLDFILQVIPIELDTHNVSGFAIYTDITEQREREEQLRQQNERLDQFASIISHDLRNPLSVATGFLELARETGDDEHFDRVERALDDMQEFLDDLLQLAREGRLVGDLTNQSLEALARRAWANVATGEATLEFEDDCPLTVDEMRAVELLENLVINAVEHAGEEPTVRIGPLPCESDDPPGFYVADDGPGIPEDEQDRIFESGYTTEASGTGLGLAIVDRIAEAHGWRVDVTDSESGGARFEFYFEE